MGSDGVQSWQPGLPTSRLHVHHQFDKCRAKAQKASLAGHIPKCYQWLALRDETIILLFAWLCLRNFKRFCNEYELRGGGWRVTVLLVCFLRTTAPLVTTLPIQKPHQWWGGGSPGTHGMTNPSWPSRPTSSVLQTSLLSGPNRWSSLHHSLPGCWRSKRKLQKHPAGKTNGRRSRWPISMKTALRKCLSQSPTANDQLFFLLLGG